MAVPQPIEMALVVQRVQTEDEGQQQSNTARCPAWDPRGLLHAGDPRAEAIDGDEWGDDQDESREEGQYRQAWLDRVVPEKAARFIVDLVNPDVGVDAERDERQTKPHPDDVALLVRLIPEHDGLRHSVSPERWRGNPG